MSQAITHLYLACKIKSFDTVKDNSEFLIGNIYPDIRYTKCIDRDRSHQTDRKELIKILSLQSDFHKGRYLHTIIDKIRITKAVDYKIVILTNGKVTPDEYLKDSIIKISEEIYFSKKLSSKKKEVLSNKIKISSQEEIDFTLKNKNNDITDLIANNNILLWNQAISQYLLNFPTVEGINNLLRLFNLTDTTFVNLYKKALAFLEIKEVIVFLEDLENNIDKYFNTFLLHNKNFIDEPEKTVDKTALELIKEYNI